MFLATYHLLNSTDILFLCTIFPISFTFLYSIFNILTARRSNVFILKCIINQLINKTLKLDQEQNYYATDITMLSSQPQPSKV